MSTLQTTIASVMKGAAVTNVVKAISHADFGFSAAQLASANRARISCRTGGVMLTYDNATDPTATVGHLVAANESLVIEGTDNIRYIRFIREAGTDSTVTVTLEV
ncbi:MAG: hypothetical protein JXR84_15335 [Anaerolineae bacterium]|nr:hypothetical protein [Anaerolineae bacterium]